MSGGPLVLVVEDDQIVRELLHLALGDDGFEVESASDGLEGLLKIRMHAPAVVVLDLSMPAVGGLRLLDELAEEHNDVPVVVVTGDVEAGHEAQRRLGADRVFLKPFDVDELSRRLRELVYGQGAAT